MTPPGPSTRGVVRRGLTRAAAGLAVVVLAGCGLDAQPEPEPIPTDRLPDALVGTADGSATPPAPSSTASPESPLPRSG